MPIPFILGGLAAVLLGHASRSVANDMSEEVNSVIEEMKALQHKTNERIQTTKKMFEKGTNEYHQLRVIILAKTLQDFSGEFSKLKKVNFEEFGTLKITNEFLPTEEVHVNVEASERWAVFESPVLSTLLISPSFMFVEGFVSYMKNSYKLDEAKAQFSKLKVEAEKATISCVRIESMTEYVYSLLKTVQQLQKLTDKGTAELASIIENEGALYNMYSAETKANIRDIVNVVSTLNQILNKEIFLDSGELNPELDQFVNGNFVL